MEVQKLVPIRKKIYNMIVPIIMESILQLSAALISMAMIGRISAVAVSAIGISTRITQVIWALFKGIATGSCVFISQSYGAGDIKKLKHMSYQTLLSSLILVIALGQIIFHNSRYFLSIFNPSQHLMYNANIYIRIVSIGLPFMVIMLIVTAVLQGMGDAKTPMIIAFIMNVINVVLSYILIFGKIGFPSLGITGAAISLVIAQIVGAVLGLYILFNRQGVLSGMIKKYRAKLFYNDIKRIYKVGLPTSMESIFWQIAAIILTKAILTYGETTLAAYQLALQAEAISYMPAAGFAVASTAFIGQALGAKDSTLGKQYLKEIAKGTIVFTSVGSCILLFLPSYFMRALTDNVEVIKIGARYLFIMGLVQIPQNLSHVLNGALRGAGYTYIPMIVAGIGLWGVRVPFTILLTYYFKVNITIIWIVMSIDLILRFILSSTLYKVKDIYNAKLVI